MRVCSSLAAKNEITAGKRDHHSNYIINKGWQGWLDSEENYKMVDDDREEYT